MALGAEGLREVAETAVLNNNYLAAKLAAIPGVEVPYADGNAARRLEQIRYSWRELADETGVGTDDIARRTGDFGVSQYFTSHHPWLVAGADDARAVRDGLAAPTSTRTPRSSRRSRARPTRSRSSSSAAPHASTVHKLDAGAMDDPERWALTWRAWKRKRG